MKTIIAVVFFAVTSPLLAQDGSESDKVLQLALNAVPHHLQSVRHPVLEGIGSKEYAISSETVGGAESSLHEFVLRGHSAEIADELLAAYRVNETSVQRITAPAIEGIPVLNLGEFLSSGTSYSWPKLNDKYPDIRAVVRVSRPAVDQFGTFAIVRYEIISKTGPVWASFWEFEKQGDGAWKDTHGVVGNLWK